jgi:hypothetical protein
LRDWALYQREALDRHPWLTQMPMAAPPLAPNSAHFVERAMEAMDETGLPDMDKMRMIGLLTSYTLTDARMAYDAKRAMAAAAAAVQAAAARAEDGPAATPAWTYEALLRELVDEETYPRLYRLAWSQDPASQPDEHEEFTFGIDRILDGIQAYIDRTTGR